MLQIVPGVGRGTNGVDLPAGRLERKADQLNNRKFIFNNQNRLGYAGQSSFSVPLVV